MRSWKETLLVSENEKLTVPGPTTPPTGALPKRPMPIWLGVPELTARFWIGKRGGIEPLRGGALRRVGR